MRRKQSRLRELTRDAVGKRIAATAHELFVEHGYDETTIDDIARAVGMSQRSMFRYFPTKEDIVVGKFDLGAEQVLDAMRARPDDEPVWESLRRSFDALVPSVDAPGMPGVVEPMQRVVFSTPHLLARFLEKLHRLRDGLAAALRDRAAAAGEPYADDDPAPAAVAAAACGCLLAAQQSWMDAAPGQSFEAALDRAMAALAPRDRTPPAG